MTALNILSGGAAQGLVASLAPQFKAQSGLDIAGEFGAVGAMTDKLRSGIEADVIILTATIVARLAEENRLISASIADIGMVETAVAVRAGDAEVKVNDAAALRDALCAADAIFVPDINESTAGIHVAKVLQQLDLTSEVAARLRIFPNGATAMRQLAASDAVRPIGYTQSTEIISTKGVKLSGSLPRGYDLATTYTAAVTAQAAHAKQAQTLINLLVGADHDQLRARAGFLETRR